MHTPGAEESFALTENSCAISARQTCPLRGELLQLEFSAMIPGAHARTQFEGIEMGVAQRSPRRSEVGLRELTRDLGWMLAAILFLVLTMLVAGMDVGSVFPHSVWAS